jgi:hypothetical protein
MSKSPRSGLGLFGPDWEPGSNSPDPDLPFAAREQHRHDVAAWRVYEIISEFPDAEALIILNLASTRLTLNRMIQKREKERPQYAEK